MIFISQDFKESVADATGSLPPEYKVVKNLDKKCGANVIVSRVKFPPMTDELLKKHDENNSIFITLVDNYIDVKNIISKAVEFGARNRMVVYLGSVKSCCGYVKIDGLLNMPEKDYLNDKLFFIMLGFSFVECSHGCLEYFLDEINKRVNSDEPVAVLPGYTDAKIADDWRATVSTLPLIGLERANYLWSKYGERPLLDVLSDLTNLKINNEGVARIIAERVRDYVGLPEGFSLWLKHDSEE